MNIIGCTWHATAGGVDMSTQFSSWRGDPIGPKSSFRLNADAAQHGTREMFSRADFSFLIVCQASRYRLRTLATWSSSNSAFLEVQSLDIRHSTVVQSLVLCAFLTCFSGSFRFRTFVGGRARLGGVVAESSPGATRRKFWVETHSAHII